MRPRVRTPTHTAGSRLVTARMCGLLSGSGRTPILDRVAGIAGRFDDRVVVAEHDRALAAAGALQPGAQFGEVIVGIDDVALDGQVGDAIVAAIVESDPLSAELAGLCCLGPAQMTANHTLTPLLPCRWGRGRRHVPFCARNVASIRGYVYSPPVIESRGPRLARPLDRGKSGQKLLTLVGFGLGSARSADGSG